MGGRVHPSRPDGGGYPPPGAGSSTLTRATQPPTGPSRPAGPRLRVALVSEHASPLTEPGTVDAGGQNVHVRALALALAASGHRVVVHTRRTSPEQPATVPLAPGVEVEHVVAGPAAPVEKDHLLGFMDDFAANLQRSWAACPPDVVHAHFWMSGLASLAAAAASGTPVVQTFHALGVVKRREQGAADTSPPGRVEIEADVARRAGAIVATCADEARELVALGAPAARIRVVPCGVDLDLFTPDGPVEPRRPGLRRLAVVGRLVARKGVDDVIRALAHVPDTELVVAGGPAPYMLDSDPEVVRLRAVADAAGVATRVRFLGQVARDRLPALLRSSDLVVCTPWYEPFGMVPLESMACGVPVVVRPVGGLAETVRHGLTGLHVPDVRPPALGGALGRLLADEPARRRMAAASVARARALYSWQRVAALTSDAYRAAHRSAVPAGRP